MNTPAERTCWICRKNKADTGEHKTKRSDLKALLGATKGPFYYHDPNRANRIVQSIDSKILKFPVPICAYCNNSHTQPHDLAWEWMSAWLRTRSPKLRIGEIIRATTIFPYDTRKQMLNVHLYFLKLFGGMICEGIEKGNEIPIDVAPFADAITCHRAHPEVFLQFGVGDGTIGRSNLECWIREDHKYVAAAWTYRVGSIAVNVIYLQRGERWEGLDRVWHPTARRRKLDIVDARAAIAHK